MSRYSIFAPKEVNVKSESIKLYSQELLWNDQPISGGGGGGVTTLAPVSGPGNANAGNISANTLTLAPCDVDHPGVLASGDQYFPPGTKHFQANVTLPTTGSGGTSGVLSIGTTQLHNFSGSSVVKNTFLGVGAGNFTNTGTADVAIGTGSGSSLTTANDCTFLGDGAGNFIDTGNNVICIGKDAGQNLMPGASNNICIGADGTEGSGLIQIGRNDQHQALFLSGIQTLDSWPDNAHKVMIDYPVGNSNLIYDISLDNFKSALGSVSDLAPIGSTPNANGATISGNTLNLQPADTNFGGVVTTGAQTFAGTKTFSSVNTTSCQVSAINSNVITGGTLVAVDGSGNLGVTTGASFQYHTDHSILLNSRAASESSTGADNVILRTGSNAIAQTGANNCVLIGLNAGSACHPLRSNMIMIGSNAVGDSADPAGTIRIGNIATHVNLFMGGIVQNDIVSASNLRVMFVDTVNGQIYSTSLSGLKAALAATP